MGLLQLGNVGGMKLFMKSMGYILHRRIFSCFLGDGVGWGRTCCQHSEKLLASMNNK